MTEQRISNHTRQFLPPNKGWKSALAWAILSVPVLYFAYIWQQYAINIPKWDDHALRAFLFYSDQEPTLAGKIYQLFRQHNEHRIVYDRLIARLDYLVFGRLNFVHLMLLGNTSLVGLLWLFTAALRRSLQGRQSVVYALPIALLLFTLSHWENMFWGMAALQNFSVVLWALATFYWLSFTRLWGVALVSALLATLTSGNGLLVWPIGFVILFLRLPAYSSPPPRPAYRPLVGWLAGAAIVIGLYFTGFEKPGGTHSIRPGLTELVKGWLVVLGAAAEAVPINPALRLCMWLGGIIALLTACCIGWTIWSNRHQPGSLISPPSKAFRNTLPSVTLFFWASAGFILGTTVIVAWARTGFGLDLLMTSRYKIYSLTALSLLYWFSVVSIPATMARWWLVISFMGSLALTGLSHLSFLDETIWWRHWLTTSQFNWSYTTNRPIAALDSITRRYTPPASAFYEAGLTTIYGPARQPAVPIRITPVQGGVSVENRTVPFQGFGDLGAYLLARSDKRTYLFPTRQNQRSVLSSRFIPSHLFADGFSAALTDEELQAGTYELFVLTMSGTHRFALFPTNQHYVSKGPTATAETKNW